MTIQISNNLLNFIRPSEHSVYSPSATDRWVACPFSVKFTKDIPEQTSSYAEEGTLAHSVAEAKFNEFFYGLPVPFKLQMEMACLKDQGRQMEECAEIYVNCIDGWLKNQDLIGDVLFYGLEKGVPIFPEAGCFGTADCIIIGTRGAAIIDFKYGQGKSVSPDTLQLRSYAAGMIRHIAGYPADYMVHTVIVQPRIKVIPLAHTYKVSEILKHLDMIYNAISESNKSGLNPITGNHCFWCPASRTRDPNLKCPAIKQKQVDAANEDFSKFLSDMNTQVTKVDEPNNVRDRALMKIIAIVPLLQQIASDGLEEFKWRMDKGEKIPGLQMITKLGNRMWRNSEPAYLKSEIAKINPDIATTKVVTSMKTITEIEKEIGKKNALDHLTMRKETKSIEVMGDTAREILGDLANYGIQQGNNAEIEEYV